MKRKYRVREVGNLKKNKGNLKEKSKCNKCKKEFQFGSLYLFIPLSPNFKFIFLCSRCWDLKNTEEKI